MRPWCSPSLTRNREHSTGLLRTKAVCGVLIHSPLCARAMCQGWPAVLACCANVLRCAAGAIKFEERRYKEFLSIRTAGQGKWQLGQTVVPV